MMYSIQCQVYSKFEDRSKKIKILQIKQSGFLVLNEDDINFYDYLNDLTQMKKTFNLLVEDDHILIIPKFS